MTMRRAIDGPRSVLAGLALLAAGCGHDPFGAPSRPRAASTASGPEGTDKKATFLVYVVPSVPVGDLEIWGQRAQHEANDRKAIFRVMGPRPGESQAQVIGRAIADGASALIVAPGDEPELPAALESAESRGVPVVLIGGPAASPAGSKPFTRVDFAPTDESARRIVGTALEDAKKAGRPVDGAALLMVDRVTDAASGLRVAALLRAAESSGVGKVVPVPYDGSVADSARRAVADAVKAHPDVAIVLADDAEGIAGAAEARIGFVGKPAFFVGGFMDYRPSAMFQPPTRESCFVEGRFAEMGAQAVVTALARLAGEPSGGTPVLVPRFTRGFGVVAVEGEAKKIMPMRDGKVTPEDESKPTSGPPRP